MLNHLVPSMYCVLKRSLVLATTKCVIEMYRLYPNECIEETRVGFYSHTPVADIDFNFITYIYCHIGGYTKIKLASVIDSYGNL